MGVRTGIQWCDSTCNVVMGCSGCELGPNCFARQWCQRFAGKKGYPKDFSKPEVFRHRLADLQRWPDLTGTKRAAVLEPWKPFRSVLEDRKIVIPAKPWLDGMPRLVFLSDLGEMFDPSFDTCWRWLGERELPERFSVLEQIDRLPHICTILTKQARRMAAFFAEYPCPPNLWLGVSVTDQSTLWRVDELLKIDCKVKIISHEPATGGIDYGDRLNGIQGLISGGMSGPRAAPCDLAWLRSDHDQARAAGAAWFCKQLGAASYEALSTGNVWTDECARKHGLNLIERHFGFKHPSGGDPAEWPEDLRVREIPKP